jgi:hypothetical protein
VKQPADPDAGFHPPTCADLSVLTVSDPVLQLDGGGNLHPGSVATLDVKLNEVAGKGFSAYPSVVFTSDNPGVTLSTGAQFYAILACETLDAPATLAVGANVAPGTTVTVKAQVAMLGATCPNAYAIAVPIMIY